MKCFRISLYLVAQALLGRVRTAGRLRERASRVRSGTAGVVGRREAAAAGPGGATVSARVIDRIAYLPAAAAEHPPSARLSARRRLQPGQLSPLHGCKLARRVPAPRARGRAHREARHAGGAREPSSRSARRPRARAPSRPPL